MSQRSSPRQNAGKTLRLMPCHAGGRSYYLDAASVRSVHRKEEWRLNWRSDSPLGWIRHGESELPVLDLARALGVVHSQVADNAFVVDTVEGPRAWGVGGVGRVISVAGDQILPVPEPCLEANGGAPWLGLVTGQETEALCLAPQLLGAAEMNNAAVFPAFSSSSSAAAAPPSAGAKPTGRAILFSAYDGKGRLPEIRFCFGFGQIGEFITAPQVIPFPGGPAWLSGLLVWRERTVPIVNLALASTGKPLPIDTEDFLVVRATAGGIFAAVTVFGRPDTVELPFQCEQAASTESLAHPDWFQGIYRRKHQVILLPDLSAILAEPGSR